MPSPAFNFRAAARAVVPPSDDGFTRCGHHRAVVPNPQKPTPAGHHASITLMLSRTLTPFTVSPSSKTLGVAITEIYAGYSPYGKPWELIMALGVVMMVPIVILVILSQRSIVRGLVGGAIK